jgi:hypothetical protein
MEGICTGERNYLMNGLLFLSIHGLPVPSDPICLSTYVYRNEFDYLLGVPSPVPSPNEGLDSSGVNGTPINNKGLGL